MNGKIISELRKNLTQMPQPRDLPEVPEDLEKRLNVAAQGLNNLPPILRLAAIAAICYENARLVQEVNRLRADAGYQPLPVYVPGTNKHGKQ